MEDAEYAAILLFKRYDDPKKVPWDHSVFSKWKKKDGRFRLGYFTTEKRRHNHRNDLKTKANKYVVEEGKLRTTSGKIVLKESEIDEVLKQFHVDKGHRGARGMFEDVSFLYLVTSKHFKYRDINII